MKNRSIIRRRVWLWLPILLVAVLLVFTAVSFLSAIPIRKQLNGMVFSNVKDLSFNGEQYTAIQFTVSGRFINQQSLPVWSDDPFDGSLVYKSFVDGEHYFFVYKNLFGKYVLKWGGATSAAFFRTAVLDVNEENEIVGFTLLPEYFYRIDEPLF